MRTSHFRVILACAMAILAFGAAIAQTPPPPAPLSELVRQIDIPFQQFTLGNGLRVVVHTDRKTPIVAVSVWYGVGSSYEPVGKTGFAHLFEHLMFNGSGAYDGEFFLPLEEVGATDSNGTTNVDRTNYFENIPTSALDLALFLEADRMGNLLPAVTQAKLDNQRGVVQNEKRQGDNQPYGLFRYAYATGLFPEGHPYRHTTIGSMADLDAASLSDVQGWFRRYYAPNNAVLVLAGDIDVAAARRLTQKYFGAIPRGPDVAAPTPAVPDRNTETRQTISDRVANPRLYLTWATPGRLADDFTQLDIATTILAGGSSSRLHNALVRDEQIAISVGASAYEQQLAGVSVLTVDVKPGVNPALAEKRVRELLATFLADGPTQDEVLRVATREVAWRIRGLEEIGGFGGKAATLAEGALYARDPRFYRRSLTRYATATPATVRAAARHWLSDGSHTILMQPGERGPVELALAGIAAAQPDAAIAPTSHTPDRSRLPAVSAPAPLTIPAVERATLSNGVQVTFARRAAAPVVIVRALFDAGAAADDAPRPGTQRLMNSTMREGTTTRTGRQISEEAERLGAVITNGFSFDWSDLTIQALKPNLPASLALLADIARNPTFAPAEVERLRAIQLSLIAQQENDPNGMANRALQPRLYGPAHPYGKPSSLGATESVRALTRDNLVAFHQRWIRPDNMQLFIVGDAHLEQLLPLLERTFGDWQAPAGVAKGEKRFTAPAPQGQGAILLIDRPNSPQSVISAGTPVGLEGSDDHLALRAANAVLGGSFTSRLNSDLRETRGWSYGAGSGVSEARRDLIFNVFAPVQADRTGESVAAIKQDIEAFQAARPVTAEELARAINNETLSLPGQYETAWSVLYALQTNAVLSRPDDYLTTLVPRYRVVNREEATAAIRQAVDPAKLTWVIVGDARVVEPQLARLGMPVEVRRATTP